MATEKWSGLTSTVNEENTRWWPMQCVKWGRRFSFYSPQVEPVFAWLQSRGFSKHQSAACASLLCQRERAGVCRVSHWEPFSRSPRAERIFQWIIDGWLVIFDPSFIHLFTDSWERWVEKFDTLMKSHANTRNKTKASEENTWKYSSICRPTDKWIRQHEVLVNNVQQA